MRLKEWWLSEVTGGHDVSKRWYVVVNVLRPQGLAYDRYKYSQGINRLKGKAERKEALAAMKLAYAEMLREGRRPPLWLPPNHTEPVTRITAAAALQTVLADYGHTLRATTRRTYQSAARVFLQWLEKEGLGTMPVEGLNAELMGRWWKWERGRKISNTTRNKDLGHLSTLLGRMVERNWLAANPCAGIKKVRADQRLHQAFTPARRKKVADYLAENHPWLHQTVALMYYCGLRRSEVLALKVGDFRRRPGYIAVPGHVIKTGHAPYIKIPPALAAILNPEKWTAQDAHFVITLAGRPGPRKVHPDTATHTHADVLKKLRIPGDLYSWRHTSAVALVMAGHNMKDVQSHFRHSSLAVTERYLRSLGLAGNNRIADNFPEL